MGGLSGLTTVLIWICGSFMLLCVLVALVTRQRTYWHKAKWLAIAVVFSWLIALINDAFFR